MTKLYVVPTPIGNLSDMSFRAIEILKKVDVVLAEDTRTSGKLFTHFEIENTLRPYHMHNEHTLVARIVDDLKSGTTAALISDAGTPGISDPGYLLIRACIENNISVECLPGAVALIPALVVSGFPTDRFIFEGFLPHKKGRIKRIQNWADETRTIVLYESPYRLKKLLEQLDENLGATRQMVIARELSKKFESVYRGTIGELLELVENETLPVKGEFVVVLSGCNTKKQ